MITQHENAFHSTAEAVGSATQSEGGDVGKPVDGSPESVTDEVSVDSSEKSASIQKYEDEWAQLYRGDDPELGELRRRAVLGNLRASRFRSVCWRCLLGVFSPDNSQWLSQLRQSRDYYDQLLQKLFMEPWDRQEPEKYTQSLVDNNPLSQNVESIWHQYFCDRDLKAVIRQDVIRTFPGVDFFREDKIQLAMVNILFCYARENPAMCYRQGMHEILAPLLFVLHCDHQALLHTKEQVQVNEVISEVLNPDYLEADGYSLFAKIIAGIESCYRINNLTPDATGYFPSTLRSPSERTEIEVVAQLNEIKDNLLLPNDRPLHQHLENLDIPLPLFGIRWLRVLFGREFPLQDLLVLWDAIFAEGDNFELVNFVVAAMLIAIRDQLLNGDYTMCLTYLMRYPGAVDITCIIEHALYLKDPQKYCCPPMTSFPNVLTATVGGRNESRTAKSEKKPEPQSGGGTLNRLKKLSTKSSRPTSTRPASRITGRNDVDAAIVDGYTLDDPAVIRAELQHAHQVMALCQLKLAQYHDVLQRSVYPSDVVEAQQALDGIHELCSLLGSRHRPSSSPSSAEVETAYEAGETRQRLVSPPSRLVLARNQSMQGAQGPVARRPGPSEVALKLFKKSEGLSGQGVAGAPLQDPTLDRAQEEASND